MSKTNDPAVNTAIEAVAKKFGVSDVDALKILVGKGAENIAENSGARAFSTNSRIILPGGQSKATVGHELSHVIQQNAAKIQNSK